MGGGGVGWGVGVGGWGGGGVGGGGGGGGGVLAKSDPAFNWMINDQVPGIFAILVPTILDIHYFGHIRFIKAMLWALTRPVWMIFSQWRYNRIVWQSSWIMIQWLNSFIIGWWKPIKYIDTQLSLLPGM